MKILGYLGAIIVLYGFGCAGAILIEKSYKKTGLAYGIYTAAGITGMMATMIAAVMTVMLVVAGVFGVFGIELPT